MARCTWDDAEYEPKDSDAENTDKYCCRECELNDMVEDKQWAQIT